MCFNYTQLIQEVLEPLAKMGELSKEVLCLDLDTDQYEHNIRYEIENDTIILLEGVLLFRPPMIEYLDGMIFLDISFDEVLNRAKIRDVPKYGEAFLLKYQNKYIPIQKHYIEEWNPKKKADVVIDNNDYRMPRIEERNKKE